MQTNLSKGFTLVEVLIISPIVILFIGAFIALIVGLTGDSLRLNGKNVLTNDVQSALADMEASIAISKSFKASTGALVSPQGSDDGMLAFNNATSGQPDTLILNLVATDKNPTDPTRSPIYTGSSPCDSAQPVYEYTLIYFIKSGTLYKRTVLPSATTCATAWQRASCTESLVADNPSVCKKKDEKLLDSVSSLDIDYFAEGSTTPLADTAAATAASASISTTSFKVIAGEQINYSSSINQGR